MTVWLEIIAFPPSRRNYPLTLFATLSFNYASTTIPPAPPTPVHQVHLHPKPRGRSLLLLFSRVRLSRSTVASVFLQREKPLSSPAQRFCDARGRELAPLAAAAIVHSRISSDGGGGDLSNGCAQLLWRDDIFLFVSGNVIWTD